jgi:hypothetical protein
MAENQKQEEKKDGVNITLKKQHLRIFLYLFVLLIGFVAGQVMQINPQLSQLFTSSIEGDGHYEDTVRGFAFDYPGERWLEIDYSDTDHPSGLDYLSGARPSDFSDTVTSINIIGQPVQSGFNAELALSKLRQDFVGGFVNYEELNAESAVSEGNVVDIEYLMDNQEGEGSVRLRQRQKVLSADNGAYVMVLTTTPELYEAYKDDIIAIFDSFTLIDHE